VGIIGYGRVAERAHLPALRELHEIFDVAAVADPAAENLRRARGALGLEPQALHRDAASLIDAADVDVVLLATPPSMRPRLAEAALRAGMHVVAEKPLAVSADAVGGLLRVAGESPAQLIAVHNYLFLPEVVATRRAIDAGEIGAVEHASVRMLGVVPGDDDWRNDPARSGGGVLMDMLHAVYLARWFTGEPARTVTALTRRPSGADIEDLALVLTAGTATTASVSVGWGHGPGGFDVVGESGRIAVRYQQDGTPPFAPLASVSATGASGRRRELEAAVEDPRRSFVELWRDVARVLAAGGAPRAGGDDAAETLEVVRAAYDSALSGRHVVLRRDGGGRGAPGIAPSGGAA